jgi:hypothetical protein
MKDQVYSQRKNKMVELEARITAAIVNVTNKSVTGLGNVWTIGGEYGGLASALIVKSFALNNIPTSV